MYRSAVWQPLGVLALDSTPSDNVPLVGSTSLLAMDGYRTIVARSALLTFRVFLILEIACWTSGGIVGGHSEALATGTAKVVVAMKVPANALLRTPTRLLLINRATPGWIRPLRLNLL